jgi:EAL domain-containing protein (putative c-di-GMP-specific phosphodiesterase class I)
VQGYFYSPPVPAQELGKLFARHAGKSAAAA